MDRERKRRLRPQRPCHFVWQPSTRVSWAVRPSYLSQVATAATYADEYCHLHRSDWLQKHTDLRALDFARCPDLRHQPRLANVTSREAEDFVELRPAAPEENKLKETVLK